MGDHHHHHSHSTNKKVLFLSFLIITSYMFVEAIGGLLTNSLALLSDAGHMFSDAVSLGIALLAIIFAARVVNENRTIKESEQLLEKIEHDLLHQNIHHVTIQVETKTHKHEHSIYCTVKQDTNAHHHHHH